ncbi:MAG: DNA polymerase III subunit alpha, partial [Cryobacterium sp.]
SQLATLPGGTEVLLAGVRRATNTPPMRGGRRVVFVSLDDGTGPVANVVFFHDAQESIGSGVFQTELMLVRGRTRRSGARGVSVTGDGMWDLVTVARNRARARAAAAKAEQAGTAPGTASGTASGSAAAQRPAERRAGAGTAEFDLWSTRTG